CGWQEYLLVPDAGPGIYTRYAYKDGARLGGMFLLNNMKDVLGEGTQQEVRVEGYKIAPISGAWHDCTEDYATYVAGVKATAAEVTYHVYFRPLGPITKLDFKIIPSETTPGKFSFQATSSDSEGRIISHTWQFEDGVTSAGDTATRTYSRAGTFPVVLFGEINGSPVGSVTKNVTVEATKLDVNMRFTDHRTNGLVPPDKDFGITLDILADNGLGGISDVSVNTTFGNAKNLEIVSAPNIPKTLTLSPGEKISYDWLMRPTSGGRWRIAGTVTGVDSNNQVVEAFDAQEGEVEGNELTAKITLTPDHIEAQEEDLNGEPVPIEFRADLSICNNTSEPINDVNLQQFRAIPAFAQSFYVTQLSGPDIDTISGLDIGTLAASTCVSYNATFLAKDDNEIEVDARVTGVSPVGVTLSGTDEAFLSIGPKYLLEVSTEILRPGANEALLPAGDTIRIGGKVKNLSNTHKILLGPLYPELSGNAGAQSLSWNNSGTDPDAFEVPEYPQYLEPGEEKEFTVRITTLASDPRHGGDPKPHGGTRADITFTPWGIATNPKGEQTIIKEDRIKSDASDLQLTISIDDSIPVPETDYLALAGGVMIGSAEAAGAMAAGLVLGVVEAVKLPYTVIAGASTYQSRVWSSFTEEEKSAFANDVGFLAASVLLRNYDMAQQDFASLWDSANQAVLNSMTEMANEWELGNHSDVARVYAKYGGEVVGQVALPFAMAKLSKSAEAANALKRAQAALNAEMAPLLSRVDDVVSVERISDILFTVKNGTEADLSTLRKVMGYTEEEVGELQRIATKYGALLTSRSRQAESIRWVQKFLAKLKPEAFKVKSVSPLDELLGYPTIYGGESSVGALVFKKPDALVLWEQNGGSFGDAIIAFLKSKGISPDEPLWEEAVNRILLRADEWKKYEKTYKQWSERGWIETTFTNEFNGIGNETWLQVNPKFVTQGAGKFEGFRLRKIQADGSPYEAYVMELFDGNDGKWRPVTGDIDNIAFTRTDGTALDELTHAQIT
ncbi:MAG TPA: PKD domain-containing protein, partial [Gammaproteobacteria bacterium]|nr:PKD domain-containing protein [Gammaproteobacteria bacterium]